MHKRRLDASPLPSVWCIITSFMMHTIKGRGQVILSNWNARSINTIQSYFPFREHDCEVWILFVHELKRQHSVTMVNVGILLGWARAAQEYPFMASKLGQYIKRSTVFSKAYGDQLLVIFAKAFPRICGIIGEKSCHHFRSWPKAVSRMFTRVLPYTDHVRSFAAMHGISCEHLCLPYSQLRDSKRHTFN